MAFNKTRIINKISQGTMALIEGKVRNKEVIEKLQNGEFDAVGLYEANVEDIIYASDVAEKASKVITCEISGNCPQHMTCLGIFGTISNVTTAIKAVEKLVIGK